MPYEIFRRVGSRQRFLAGYPLAWIEEPRSRVLQAFWVPHDWVPYLERLSPGAPPTALPDQVRHALSDASILVDLIRCQAELSTWTDVLAVARVQFATLGYVNLCRLVHGLQLESLADYFRRVASGGIKMGDSQCARRVGIHNEPMARFLHTQLVWLVSQIAGEAVIPSYAYFAGYRGGAELSRHTDREQCEFSISLLVDYQAPSHETHEVTSGSDSRSSWPLWLETAGGVVAIDQRPGDALLYRGTRLPHWRTRLHDEHRSDSVLLHYVPQSFSGPLR